MPISDMRHLREWPPKRPFRRAILFDFLAICTGTKTPTPAVIIHHVLFGGSGKIIDTVAWYRVYSSPWKVTRSRSSKKMPTKI